MRQGGSDISGTQYEGSEVETEMTQTREEVV